MGFKIKRFYGSEEDFEKFHHDLKLTPCPFCKMVGTLILNGRLRGYDESSNNKKIIRGRKIICNKRKKHKTGCGRSFSILAAHILKNFMISAESLWLFLKNIAKGMNKINALKSLNIEFAESNAYRMWNNFCNAQSRIRTFLLKICSTPKLSSVSDPALQTVAHIEKAFKDSFCGVCAFQMHFQASFL